MLEYLGYIVAGGLVVMLAIWVTHQLPDRTPVALGVAVWFATALAGAFVASLLF